MKKPLVVSAAGFEVLPLLGVLASHGIIHDSIETGIGALEASARSEAIAHVAAGREVIFVGTAGTFGMFSKPFLCTTRRVTWMPACERMGLGYGIPRGAIHSVDLPPDTDLTTSLPRVNILCSPSISLDGRFDPLISRHFNPSDCAENLELYSCIRPLIASAANVSVLIGITNGVGPAAHEEWKQWHGVAAEMTAEHVNRILSGKGAT